MKTRTTQASLLAVLLLPALVHGQGPVDPDPNGVLRKPIPDKLIVLTFDDGCASGYTVAAPILKQNGFGGTFYVCDFDSFKTRKDWYLTWRQMRALNDEGFEIGNHTVGHAGSLSAFQAMEDELFANNGLRMTTVCWPLYGVAWNICPDLSANGYTFGRGGHERPYRPTVDNPFDVPSFTMRDGLPIETFIKQAQQACQGRVVVYCFHGVPDLEHAGVSVAPATFKAMMQYLKDNHYQVIAMRDMADYIDPAKAAKLPPTANEVKDAPPFLSVKDAQPYVAPPAMDMRPVTATNSAVRTAKDMLTFVLPGAISCAISATRIDAYVPPTADLKALAPAFTVSTSAAAVPASGTARDFTTPQTYTITAQDGSTKTYTVAAVNSGKDASFAWVKAEPGNWSEGSKWSNGKVAGVAPAPAGQPDCIVSFNMTGKYTVTNDLKEGFQLNQLNLGVGQGNALTLAGKSLKFSHNTAAGVKPSINQYSGFTSDTITAPVDLAADLALNLIPGGGRLTIAGLISGSGGLVYTGGNGNASSDLNGGPNQHYSTLSINTPANTYSGGTIINGGTLRLAANTALGSGPLTLNDGAGLVPGPGTITTPLILNGGTIDAGGVNWNAPITLNGNTRIAGHQVNLNQARGAMSGPGGFTQVGTWGAFGRSNDGSIFLWGDNTYAGPTIVQQGALFLKQATSLYHADSTQWTPAKIRVCPAATLVISAGGPGEFTGTQVGTLLRNLTSLVRHNGLMNRAVVCVDTANATGTVTVSSNITNSNGPGGGAFVLKKCQAGTLQLTGASTYSGQTVLEGGTLSVASLNSVVKGKPTSSLGAPNDIEGGEIVIGKEAQDGDCALVYTGTGETSDRVMNLAGKKSTVTFDQSGTGLLKLTSPFVISGYGANKTLVLKGSTAGKGELAGKISNPYDRKQAASMALTKTGTGTWTLSGANSYTGPTTVTQGTLSLANASSLGDKSEVSIADGATLDLNFEGEISISKIYLGGKLQPGGRYDAKNSPRYIQGKGVLKASAHGSEPKPVSVR
jgi:autotransporter-associated beta strand protein